MDGMEMEEEDIMNKRLQSTKRLWILGGGMAGGWGQILLLLDGCRIEGRTLENDGWESATKPMNCGWVNFAGESRSRGPFSDEVQSFSMASPSLPPHSSFFSGAVAADDFKKGNFSWALMREKRLLIKGEERTHRLLKCSTCSLASLMY
jgi:hypothetical protein